MKNCPAGSNCGVSSKVQSSQWHDNTSKIYHANSKWWYPKGIFSSKGSFSARLNLSSPSIVDSQLDPPWCGCCRRHSNHSNDLQHSEQEDHVHQWHWTTYLANTIIFKKRTRILSEFEEILKINLQDGSHRRGEKPPLAWSEILHDKKKWSLRSWPKVFQRFGLFKNSKPSFLTNKGTPKTPSVCRFTVTWQFTNWALPSHCHYKPWRWSTAEGISFSNLNCSIEKLSPLC